jgi:hypothetical protein
MTRDEAEKIIVAYIDLVSSAALVSSRSPYYSEGYDELVMPLYFEDDQAVISWRCTESDYYGGSYTTLRSFKFPIDILLMRKSQIEAIWHKVDAEEKEKERKVRAAQAAVDRDRREAHDRAEFARLSAKYAKERA